MIDVWADGEAESLTSGHRENAWSERDSPVHVTAYVCRRYSCDWIIRVVSCPLTNIFPSSGCCASVDKGWEVVMSLCHSGQSQEGCKDFHDVNIPCNKLEQIDDGERENLRTKGTSRLTI